MRLQPIISNIIASKQKSFLNKTAFKSSSLGIDEFKKRGNFDQGRAIFESNPYTGIIDIYRKNRKEKISIEYKDGVMQSSKRYGIEDVDGVKIEQPYSFKKYETMDNANIIKIYQIHHYDCIIKPSYWSMTKKVTVEDGKVTIEKPFNIHPTNLVDVVQKNKDGSWHKIVSSIETGDIGRLGTYYIVKKDLQTGEIIEKIPHRINASNNFL